MTELDELERQDDVADAKQEPRFDKCYSPRENAWIVNFVVVDNKGQNRGCVEVARFTADRAGVIIARERANRFIALEEAVIDESEVAN